MNMVEEQSRIIAMMERGATFDDVEESVIRSAPFDDEEKAALWLFAWSYIPSRKQRYDANQARARSPRANPWRDA